jgi:hypothetical protein
MIVMIEPQKKPLQHTLTRLISLSNMRDENMLGKVFQNECEEAFSLLIFHNVLQCRPRRIAFHIFQILYLTLFCECNCGRRHLYVYSELLKCRSELVERCGDEGS